MIRAEENREHQESQEPGTDSGSRFEGFDWKKYDDLHLANYKKLTHFLMWCEKKYNGDFFRADKCAQAIFNRGRKPAPNSPDTKAIKGAVPRAKLYIIQEFGYVIDTHPAWGMRAVKNQSDIVLGPLIKAIDRVASAQKTVATYAKIIKPDQLNEPARKIYGSAKNFIDFIEGGTMKKMMQAIKEEKDRKEGIARGK